MSYGLRQSTPTPVKLKVEWLARPEQAPEGSQIARARARAAFLGEELSEQNARVVEIERRVSRCRAAIDEVRIDSEPEAYVTAAAAREELRVLEPELARRAAVAGQIEVAMREGTKRIGATWREYEVLRAEIEGDARRGLEPSPAQADELRDLAGISISA